MEFATVLQLIAKHLDTAGANWAVIGGVALTVRGAGRLTHDLDVATERGAQDGLVQYLESLGYETLHRSAGYSNHAHARASMGRIDVVYVGRRTAESLFGEASESDLFEGVVAKVPRTEHLVAMKVLAAKNDPTRRLRELADVVALLRAAHLDAESVRGYFEQNDMLDAWEQIRESL